MEGAASKISFRSTQIANKPSQMVHKFKRIHKPIYAQYEVSKRIGVLLYLMKVRCLPGAGMSKLRDVMGFSSDHRSLRKPVADFEDDDAMNEGFDKQNWPINEPKHTQGGESQVVSCPAYQGGLDRKWIQLVWMVMVVAKRVS